MSSEEERVILTPELKARIERNKREALERLKANEKKLGIGGAKVKGAGGGGQGMGVGAGAGAGGKPRWWWKKK